MENIKIPKYKSDIDFIDYQKYLNKEFLINEFLLASPEKDLKMFKYRNRTILGMSLLLLLYFNSSSEEVKPIRNNNIEVNQLIVSEKKPQIVKQTINKKETNIQKNSYTVEEIIEESNTDFEKENTVIKPQEIKYKYNPQFVQIVSGFHFESIEPLIVKLENLGIEYKLKEKNYTKGTLYVLLAGPFDNYHKSKEMKEEIDYKLNVNSLIKKAKKEDL